MACQEPTEGLCRVWLPPPPPSISLLPRGKPRHDRETQQEVWRGRARQSKAVGVLSRPGERHPHLAEHDAELGTLWGLALSLTPTSCSLLPAAPLPNPTTSGCPPRHPQTTVLSRHRSPKPPRPQEGLQDTPNRKGGERLRGEPRSRRCHRGGAPLTCRGRPLCPRSSAPAPSRSDPIQANPIRSNSIRSDPIQPRPVQPRGRAEAGAAPAAGGSPAAGGGGGSPAALGSLLLSPPHLLSPSEVGGSRGWRCGPKTRETNADDGAKG